MSDDDSMTIDLRGLENLMKALKAKPPTCRVGILGGGTHSSKGGKSVSNAQVGSWHEFGTSKLPVRSFLRLPVSALLEKRLEASGAFDKNVLAQVVASGTVVPWMQKVAAAAEEIVLGAFDSGGYGTWVPSDMSHKDNAQTLIETGQLRNSISSEVAT